MFPGYRFPILGGPHERSAVDRLRGEIGGLFPPLLDLTDRLSLSESATVMASCRAVVATDSGPMHMADAVGVPLVALFGAKNPLPLWLPLSDKARVLTHAVPCAGCLQSVCDRDNLCMDLITPDETLAALSDLLREPE
jgi:heptosyltransferase-2